MKQHFKLPFLILNLFILLMTIIAALIIRCHGIHGKNALFLA